MIKRKLYSALKAHLSKPEITLIVGPRQAGKTTLMLLLKRELEQAGHQTLLFNLDIETDKQFFASQTQLIRKIKLEVGESKSYIFIDEIQRKKDAGVFLKGIYDMNLPYKFVVSGSGSLELKEKIHESLAGRKQIFELSTLSFEEFINFKTQYAYEKKLADLYSIEIEKTKEFFSEYLNFGGYPKVVLGDTRSEKQNLINEIYQSYIERDIAYLLQIRKTEDFTRLVKLIASQIGNTINVAELSRTLGISQPTIRDYLWYLQKTFILHQVTPFFKNVRKEIAKSPLFYFYDLGFRNHALGTFGNLEKSYDLGFLFQNFVYFKLHESIVNTSAKIHFWRTKSGAEVDFIINTGQSQLPIEVKYQTLTKPVLTRSLHSFIEKYHPPQAFVINLSLSAKTVIKGTEITFLPFYQTPVW